MIQTINTYSGQSLYDVAGAVYSGYDHMIRLCLDNGINSINDLSLGAREITFDTTLNNGLTLSAYIQGKGYQFATLNEGVARITEDRRIRITEDGTKRILE